MTARNSNDQAPMEFIPQQVDRSGHHRVQLGRQMSIDGDQPIQKTLSATRINNSDIDSSVIFAENNDEGNGELLNEVDTLFSEVDELCPHTHEGGEITKEPKLNKSMNSYTSSVGSSQLKTSFHPFASSLRQPSRRSSSPAPSDDLQVLLNYNGSNNDTLQHKRSSIVGGKHLSDMTFDEKREIFAPERSRDSLVVTDNHESNRDDTTCAGQNQICASRSSVYAPISTGGGLSANGMVSSIDWSSLTKSCKRAKETMRDAMSSHVVVKNMFSTHFTALTAVLALYAKRYLLRMADQVAVEDLLARTIETKRAIRFAISCLAPFGSKSDLYDESARQMRQDLQQIAVEGICSSDDAGEDGNSHHGIHKFLAELIRYSPINYEEMIDIPDGEKYEVMISSLEKNQLSVRTLAARLLCNIVTDNSVAAGMVLLDIPFSPTTEQLEKRMSSEVLELNNECRSEDSTICWTDLIHEVSQIRTTKKLIGIDAEDGDNFDREVLAAVVAALHNLLVSMEMRDSLEEIDSEMKRIEELKRLRNINKGGAVDEECGCDRRGGNEPMFFFDALFEVATNSALINVLLRSVIPTHAVLNTIQPNRPADSSRSKFVPPKANGTPLLEKTSDSATEWISFVLERIVSRGLVLQVLHSAGGSGETTTPEQVVLMSCIRQAMDAYQSSIIQANESGEFDMRRLSIVAKSTHEKVPHPLWGRGDGLRAAVPVLTSLTNEVEKVRNRALTLKSPLDRASKEEYEGELNCINYIIHDILDVLGQCLGKISSQLSNDQCIMAEARSVIGRETSLLRYCCEDLALIVDTLLSSNSGKSARDLNLSLQEQETAISTVRLIGNLVYHCRHNQDLLRTTVIRSKYEKKDGSNDKDDNSSRMGLHVLLSATSLGPACFTLREWCIVAIRNAVENNEANIELVKQLEANAALGDTPELKKLGVKVELDAKGNVVVQKRESDGE